MVFSNRVQSIQPSKTVELDSLVRELKIQGQEIISLNVGEPHFSTPNEIKSATIQAINKNQTKYSFVSGIPDLREKIASSHEPYPVKVQAENILVANGSKQIIYSIFQTICNPRDEVIVLKPYWVSFPESIKLAGGSPIMVDTKQDFQLDLLKIKNAITKRTKAIIVNSPNNPTGAIYPKEDLEELAKIVLENNLVLIADEAYDELVFPPAKNYSIGLSNERIFKRTITVKSFSKTFCMTGFRIGYMIAHKEMIKAVNSLQGHMTGNTCSFAQYGAIAAVEMNRFVLDNMLKVYMKRCNQAYDLFSTLFNITKPEGAFYLFCNVEAYLNGPFKSCEDLAIHILKKAKVAVVPGSGFGMPGYIRISFATTEENIDLAYKRIKEIL